MPAGEREDIMSAVREAATREGFVRVGMASAGPAAREHVERFEAWLAAGRHGGMAYLARRARERFDPGALLAGARSVICLAATYDTTPAPWQGGAADADGGAAGLVAGFADGRDYHRRLAAMCRRVISRMRQSWPEFAGVAAVDSAPLAERTLAAAAGLGVIGRNGCLIVPGVGSHVLLAEIVCNLPAPGGGGVTAGRFELCGSCRKCVEACPSGACLGDGTVDSRLCVSYLTIEHRGPIEARMHGACARWVFGCDRCQDACPHNGGRRAAVRVSPAEVLGWSRARWDAMTRGTALRRARYEGLLRNAAIAAAAVESYKNGTADGPRRRPDMRSA